MSKVLLKVWPITKPVPVGDSKMPSCPSSKQVKRALEEWYTYTKIDLNGTIPHELILNVVGSEGKLKVIWDRKPAAAA